MTRFPAEALEPEVLALLRKKYAARPIDAVIAVATPALDFAERHRESLWPAATIVFHSVPDDALRGRKLLPQTNRHPAAPRLRQHRRAHAAPARAAHESRGYATSQTLAATPPDRRLLNASSGTRVGR